MAITVAEQDTEQDTDTTVYLAEVSVTMPGNFGGYPGFTLWRARQGGVITCAGTPEAALEKLAARLAG